MRGNLMTVGKFVVLWGAVCVGAALGGVLFGYTHAQAKPADPLSAFQAFLVVNLLMATMLALLASRLSGSWRHRSIILFVTLFVVEAVLSAIEAYVFRAAVGMPVDFLLRFTAANVVKSAIGALVAAALLGNSKRSPDSIDWKVWRVAAVVLLYVFVYFAAGFVVAWQSAAVRAYYGDGSDVDLLRLFYVQAGRGLVWAAIASLLLRWLIGARWQKAVLSGAAFAIFMAAPLLAPNDYMPWAVRQVHLLEVSVSNFIFGFLAVLILGRSRVFTDPQEQVLQQRPDRQEVTVHA